MLLGPHYGFKKYLGKFDLLRYIYEIAIQNLTIIFPSEIITTFLFGLLFGSQKSFRFTIWHLKNNLNNVDVICYLGLSDKLPGSVGRQMFIFCLAFMFSKPFMLVLK